MKLLRASCICGYRTRKARSGYHRDQWWFPVFSTTTGTLTDVLAALPDGDKKRIDQQQLDVYKQTRCTDKKTWPEASDQMKALDDEIRANFIDRESVALRNQYETDGTCIFDPTVSTDFPCPSCKNDTLTLNQVSVIAFCKTGCDHEYEWLDSEVPGCPKCGHRPHRFQTEHESEFRDVPRTTCWCPCSSSTDAISHADGYCPKCGALPDGYQIDGRHFCGIHHQELVAYKCDANWLFINNESRWGTWQFPNAKLLGDAFSDAESESSAYCVACELDRQQWLQSRGIYDG